MKFIFKIFWFVIPLAVVVILAVALPWKDWVAGQITEQMKAQGLKVVSLKIDGLTPDKIILKDIVLGDKAGLTLQNLAIDYNPIELWNGKLKTLSLSDLKLDIRQENGVWSLNGVQSQGGQGTVLIPSTHEDIEKIPVDSVTVQNAAVSLAAAFWEMSLPLSMEWKKSDPSVSIHSDSFSFKKRDLNFKTGKFASDIKFVWGKWSGAWSLDAIEIPEFPVMNLKGGIEIKDNTLKIMGDIRAANNAGGGAFNLSYPFDKPEAASLEITQGNFAWAGGKVRTEKTKIPLDGKTNLKAILDIQGISVDTVLDLMAGQDVQATGTLSGKVPLIITPQGTIQLEKGGMSANGNGLISLPASVIPGEGEQIEMTRSILKNFEYDGLSIDVQELEKNKIALILSLSGNNPKVYDGRAVKLNVRLGGDVLEFLQGNLMMFSNPQSLLDQETK